MVVMDVVDATDRSILFGRFAYPGMNERTQQIATKRDLVDLKQELAEKVFNSSMKFDIGCAHTFVPLFGSSPCLVHTHILPPIYA